MYIKNRLIKVVGTVFLAGLLSFISVYANSEERNSDVNFSTESDMEQLQVQDTEDGYEIMEVPVSENEISLFSSTSSLVFGDILNVGTGLLAGNNYPGMRLVSIDYPGGTIHEFVRAIYLNGEEVYCIEPQVLTENGAPYSPFDATIALSAQQLADLGFISYFGYGYDGDFSMEMHAATAIMIWEYLGYHTYDYNQTTHDKIHTIQHRINTRSMLPSFHDTELILDGYGKEYAKEILDDNHVLNDYHEYKNAGFQIERNGDRLKIWAEKGCERTGVIEYDRADRDRLSNPVVYKNPDNKQMLIAIRSKDARTARLHVRVDVGDIELLKTDEFGKPVSGASFIFSKSSDMSNPIGTFTSDSEGKLAVQNIKSGTYFYKEIKVGNPYVLDTAVHSVEVKFNETVKITAVNKHQKARITLHKEDAETGLQPQGEASLDGWVFGVYGDKQKSKLLDTVKGTGNTASSIELDVNQDVYIYELEAPLGYNLNPEPLHMRIDYSNPRVSLQELHGVLQDQVIKGRIAIHKMSDKDENQQILSKSAILPPMANVKFDLINSKQEIVETITTNQKGDAVSAFHPYGWYTVREHAVNGFETLPEFQVFINEEGKIYSYYIQNTHIVTMLKIVKTDSETKKQIPAAHIGFKLKDEAGNPVIQHINYPIPMEIDTFYTAEDGTVTLPQPLTNGTYTLHEVSGTIPQGYLLELEGKHIVIDGTVSLLEVCFENQPVKGKVVLRKEAELIHGYDFRMTEYGQLYEPQLQTGLLDDVVYRLSAREDIVGSEGTLWYKKGDVVDEFTMNGIEEYVKEDLPLGSYVLHEISTKQGYVLDTAPHEFTLTYAGEEIELVEHREDLWNDRQKGIVKVKKILEEASYTSLEEMKEEVVFGIYNKEALMKNGEEIVPAGSLLGITHLNDDLEAVFTLHEEGDYEIRELKTHPAYQLNEEVLPISFQFDSSQEEYIELDHLEMKNELKRGKIQVVKLDEETMQPLKGVEFGLYEDEACTQLIKEGTSDEEGKLIFDSLELHTYYLKESMALPQYALDPAVHEMKLEEQGQVIEKTLTNKKIKGTVRVVKLAKDTHTPLSDTEFTLYADEDCTQPISVQVSDVTGTVYFEELYQQTYFIKETRPPHGFQISDEVIRVTMEEQISDALYQYEYYDERISNVKTGDHTDVKTLLLLCGISISVMLGSVYLKWMKKQLGK